MTRATAIAENFLAELIVRYPEYDWDSIWDSPGTMTFQEVVDWALAAGVAPDVVETLKCIDPPGWTH